MEPKFRVWTRNSSFSLLGSQSTHLKKVAHHSVWRQSSDLSLRISIQFLYLECFQPTLRSFQWNKYEIWLILIWFLFPFLHLIRCSCAVLKSFSMDVWNSLPNRLRFFKFGQLSESLGEWINKYKNLRSNCESHTFTPWNGFTWSNG